MKDCIFCKIVRGEIPAHKVYEDDRFLAFLDIAPVNPGHTLIIPKEHFADLNSMPEDLVADSATLAQKLAPKIVAAVGAQSFNLTMNVGKLAGQAVTHAHWHIMPRFEGDGYELWHGKAYGEGEAQKIAEAIRSSI